MASSRLCSATLSSGCAPCSLRLLTSIYKPCRLCSNSLTRATLLDIFNRLISSSNTDTLLSSTLSALFLLSCTLKFYLTMNRLALLLCSVTTLHSSSEGRVLSYASVLRCTSLSSSLSSSLWSSSKVFFNWLMMLSMPVYGLPDPRIIRFIDTVLD